MHNSDSCTRNGNGLGFQPSISCAESCSIGKIFMESSASQGKLDKMRAKALEPDPDLQTCPPHPRSGAHCVGLGKGRIAYGHTVVTDFL